MLTGKTEVYKNADVIYITYACANDGCGVLIACVRVDGENATKTLVYTQAFTKTHRFENALVYARP